MGEVYKLQLIAPSSVTGQGLRRSLFPPLSLGILASLTPRDWEVKIIDESVEPVDFSEPVNLVGITSITAVAPRAYALARRFRELGAKVVLGGIHPSAVPEEAARHADAVVIGEAENVWPGLLDDFKKGRLRRYYSSKERPNLDNLPVPRRDLYNARKYLTLSTVQTSRGCPYGCSFCSVTRFFGRTYRMRPVTDVLREVEELGERLVLFVDDNIIGNPQRAKELFRALIPSRIKWLGQSSLNIASQPELLSLAARSGCIGLFIGFESLVSGNLRKIGKAMINKADKFLEMIMRIHDHGIGIEGAFIFGFDDDDLDVFKRTVEFAQKAKLAAAQFGILTPFPGTALREKLLGEGRVIESDWAKYTISNVVFEPLQMSREALQNGFNWAYREFYSYRSIASRLLLGFRKNLSIFFPINLSFRRIAYGLPLRTRQQGR